MKKIPFSENEMEIVGHHVDSVSAMFPAPPILNTPVTQEENLRAALNGESYLWFPVWQDICNLFPRVNPDHIARGQVIDGGPALPLEEKGGRDMFGVEWVFVPSANGSMEKPGNPPLFIDANDWKDVLVWPDIDTFDWEGTASLNAPFRNQTRMVGVTIQNGMFERLISFMGFENAAMAIIDDEQKDALAELFDKLADLYIHLIDKYREAINIQEVLFHDDWGSQRAPFFSLNTVMEMLVPPIRKISDHCHANNIVFQLHSCGKNELLVPAMIAAGVDIWWGQNMNDKEMLYETYGNQIMLGLDFPTPPAGTPDDEIKQMVKEFVSKHLKYPCTGNDARCPCRQFRYHIYEIRITIRAKYNRTAGGSAGTSRHRCRSGI